MSIKNLNILINDTAVGATELNIEKTENANPVLKYSGADDEYQAIMASELSFNMLVPEAVDGKFLHLFTGNETRFEVQLENADTEEIIWQGFLLPDIYSEPYEGGCFFVQFTATDGIGRLKNKYLSDPFYGEVKTVPQIIAACLAETGLKFNTIIAPAINNATVDILVSDIEIDTAQYIENNKQQNAYEILEAILVSMGCKLFMYGNNWYIIGINRFNDEIVEVENYTYLGDLITVNPVTTITREVKAILFEATPQITAVPPHKTVTVNWDKDVRDNVFPEDLVAQKLETDNVLYVPKYFSEENANDFWYILSYRGSVPTDVTDPSYQELPKTGIYNLFIAGNGGEITIDTVENNYLFLTTPIYVEASVVNTVELKLEIEGNLKFYYPPTEETIEDFKQLIMYEILQENELLISNKAAFDTFENFDFDFSIRSGNAGNYVDISLSIDGIFSSKSGEVNLKLHPPIYDIDFDNPLLAIEYTKLDLSVTQSEGLTNEYVLNRNIDFTTSQEVDIAYGFTKNDLVANRFLLGDNIEFEGIEVPMPAEEVALVVLNYIRRFWAGTTYAPDGFWVRYIYVDELSYNYMKQFPENIFIKRADTGELLPAGGILIDDENGVGWMQLEVTDDVNFYNPGDDLYLIIEAETEVLTDRAFLNDTWKPVNTTYNTSYVDALAKVYHSTIKTTKFKIDGEVFGVYSPLDLFQFNYLKARNFNATNLSLNLSQGMSSAVLVESVNQTITDYET